MAHHFRPLHDRVLLKRVEVGRGEDARWRHPSRHGQGEAVEGQVLAVGPG